MLSLGGPTFKKKYNIMYLCTQTSHLNAFLSYTKLKYKFVIWYLLYLIWE